ncbi:MAG: hypothetical protein FJ135_15205 [Deltaproteobacteria bacterium]|nr:hypothetical protein [Deltaproteobacteria bacterium]
MKLKTFVWLGLVALVLVGCTGPYLAREEGIPGEEIRPYVGLIRNFTEYDITIPSHNSSASLILPARGSLELKVWQPNIKLIGYVDGQQVYYQSIRVKPRKYVFFGKTYDFLAEVNPEKPDPWVIPQLVPRSESISLQRHLIC